MGFVGDMFSSKKGAGFQASSADIQSPVTDANAQLVQDQRQSALQQQQAFVDAIRAQQAGAQAQAAALNNLGMLDSQYRNIAAGVGPNPAANMLAQATGANTANQAALMASQRGSSANPALLARMAAQQGAANQQSAAGQAATMQANQSLAALGQLGNIYGMQAGIGTNQINQQQAAIGALNQNTLAAEQNAYNQIAAQNAARVNMQSNMNNANAQIASGNAQGQRDMFGNLTGAAGAAVGKIPMKAHGGTIDNYAEGGNIVGNLMSTTSFNKQQAPNPFANLFGFLKPTQPMMPMGDSAGVSMAAAMGADPYDLAMMRQSGYAEGGSVKGGKILAHLTGKTPMMAKGGEVEALVSPGEVYLDRKDVKKVVKGEEQPLEAGEKFPGKPKVPGDNIINDTLRRKLEVGGIVIPNSITELPPEERNKAAMQFIANELAKKAANLKRK